MCKEPTALAESTTGGQGGVPAKSQVQKRAFAGEQASATVQAAFTKANFVLHPIVAPLLSLSPWP